MGLRKYMKKHQQVDAIREPHHLFAMVILFPIYYIDFWLNMEYYDKAYYDKLYCRNRYIR